MSESLLLTYHVVTAPRHATPLVAALPCVEVVRATSPPTQPTRRAPKIRHPLT